MNSLSISGKNWILRKYNQADLTFIKDNFFLDEMSEASRNKSAELYEKLTPYKIAAGLVGIFSGLFMLIL